MRSMVLFFAVLVTSGCAGQKAPPAVDLPPEEEEPAAAVTSLSEVARRAVSGLERLDCTSAQCAWITPSALTLARAADLKQVRQVELPTSQAPTDLTWRGGQPVVTGACPQHAGSCAWSLDLESGTWTGPEPAGSPRPGEPPPSPSEAAPADETHDDIEPTVPDAPPAEPPADDAPPQAGPGGTEALAEMFPLWKHLMSERLPIPFHRAVPLPGGGFVTFSRGMSAQTGRLVASGGYLRYTSAPGTDSPVSHEGWLTLHPSGRAVYLLVWPNALVTAWDTRGLRPMWTLPLDAPAFGLFMDPAGRFLLLARTARPDPDRLADYPPLPLPATGRPEPLGPGWEQRHDVPPVTGLVVLDTGTVRVVADLEGPYRAWDSLPGGGVVVATTQEVVALAPRAE